MSRRVPTVSVVVPTKDRPLLLAQTLASVLAQRDVDLEVVVVDDASSVPVGPVEDPRACVLRLSGGGSVSAARNAGLARSSGRYVAFCDDDDLWAPTKLARQVAAMDREGASWSCCGAAQVDDELRVVLHQEPPASGDLADVLLVENVVPGGGSGVVAEAGLLRRLGGFDEGLQLLADWHLWVRLALAGPVAAEQGTLLAYRLHSGAMSSGERNLDGELARLESAFAPERTARGLTLHQGRVDQWVAYHRQRNGTRFATARAQLGTAGLGRPRALLRTAEALLWPRSYRYHDRRHRRSLSPAWLAEVEEWLGPLRVTPPPSPAPPAAGPSGRGSRRSGT